MRIIIAILLCFVMMNTAVAQEDGDKKKKDKDKTEEVVKEKSKKADKAKEEITEEVNEKKKKGDKVADAAEEEAKEKKKKGKEAKDDAVETAEEVVEEGKKKKDKAKDKSEEIADDAEEVAEDVADGDGDNKKKKKSKIKEANEKTRIDETTGVVKLIKVKKATKQAKKAMKVGNIYHAADLYEQVLEQKPEKIKLAYQAALAYDASRDYRKAEKWYKAVKDSEEAEKYPEVAYQYAMMLKMNGKYDEAITEFEAFKKSYKGENVSLYRKWLKADVEGCKLAKSAMEMNIPVEVIHLGPEVNSAYTDISPMLWDDETLLFASLPVDSLLEYDSKTGEFDYYVKFYQSELSGETFSESEKFPHFDIPGTHSSNGAFSPDKKKFYFTICDQVDISNINCKIHVSNFENGIWSEPEPLNEKINEEGYTSTHPTVMVNEKGEEVIYFASNKPRGRGGMDLWYVKIGKNGRMSNPRNCGSKINTNRNEGMPFFNTFNKMMYFSSDGHPGMGGYDIFKATGSESRFKNIENLGYPINSSADDMYVVFDDKDESGFLVSNRPGIISLKHETCCDDIFRFKYDNTIRVAVRGWVYDEDDSTRTPLNDASVNLMMDTEDRTQDIVVSEDSTENMEPFFFNLNPENSYRIAALRTGYLTGSVLCNTIGLTKSDTLEVEIFLKKYQKDRAYKLSNIYYDFDKWDIKDESTVTLDSLYNILVENPMITIELSSHTDTRGSLEYNQDLSQKRAESCVNYLIKKGIEGNRIVPKGYGETATLDDCSQYDDCGMTADKDCPCHQNNRRTEFKITGELDGELIYEDERTTTDNKSENKKPGK